ncbi:hypothetical protein PybrP1_005250, partial [[Pythium] brassicae (nom. inval.)]
MRALNQSPQSLAPGSFTKSSTGRAELHPFSPYPHDSALNSYAHMVAHTATTNSAQVSEAFYYNVTQTPFDCSNTGAGANSSCNQRGDVAFRPQLSDATELLHRQHLQRSAPLTTAPPPPATGATTGYRVFPIATDPRQADKAREIRLCSTARPHMRAFHFAWLSFFVAFFGWFSIPPLMPTIKRELQLSGDQVANADIAAVASTIIGRVIAGPLCDRYGPRTVQAALLVIGALPVACAALVTNYTGFLVVRFFIGLIGCSFVATTYWTSVMFCSEIVGRANALAAGWGNLGAGVTYLITPVIF